MPIPKIAALLLAMSCVIPFVPAAAAEMPCFFREELDRRLAGNAGETRAYAAVTASGYLVEIYAAPAGSWTMVIVPAARPDLGCILAAGQGWRPATAEPGADGERS